MSAAVIIDSNSSRLCFWGILCASFGDVDVDVECRCRDVCITYICSFNLCVVVLRNPIGKHILPTVTKFIQSAMRASQAL